MINICPTAKCKDMAIRTDNDTSSTCKMYHPNFIFIFSSDDYVLIINECDVLPMRRKKG